MSNPTPFLAPEELLAQLTALMRGDADAADPAVMDTLIALGDSARRVRDGPRDADAEAANPPREQPREQPLADRDAAAIFAAIADAYETEAGDIVPLTDGDLIRESDMRHRLISGVPVGNAWTERGIGMPVVVPKERPLILNNFATARANLRARAAPLFEAPELLDHLFIAGGICQRSLVADSANGGDVDMFPILPAHLCDAPASEQQAWGEELFERVRAHLAAIHAERGVGEAHQSRTANCITIVFSLRDANDEVREYEIQYILRFAASPAQVLFRFDLGSSAVGWWRGEFVFSRLGAIAYELGVNVLALSRRRGTAETRLVKFFNRGFAVALPELAADRFPLNGYSCRLPRLGFTVSQEDRTEGAAFPPTLVAASAFMESLSGVGRARAVGYGPPEYADLAELREYNARQLRTAERFGREAAGLVATQEDLERGITTAKPKFPPLKPIDNHRGERAQCLAALQSADRFNPMLLRTIGMDRGFIMMVTQLVLDNDLQGAREMVQAFRTPEEEKAAADRAAALEATTVPYHWGERPVLPVNADRSPLISSDRWYGDFHNADERFAAFRVNPPAVAADAPVAAEPVPVPVAAVPVPVAAVPVPADAPVAAVPVPMLAPE